MPLLSRAMQVLTEVPKNGKLAYCLLRDERVPRAPKAVLLAALGVSVGKAGDIKEVADGYGRNYLLPRKLAVIAGRGVEAEGKRLREAVAKRETKDRTEAQALADEIGNKTVVVRLKMGAEDKAFG